MFELQAALADLRIPCVEISAAENSDDEPEIELDDDPEHATLLDTSQVPVTMTWVQVRSIPELPVVHSATGVAAETLPLHECKRYPAECQIAWV